MNQLAKLIGDIATGEIPNDSPKGPIHKTLRVTPAMEAGVADHVWSLEEIAGLA